jgi:hypothetical protein
MAVRRGYRDPKPQLTGIEPGDIIVLTGNRTEVLVQVATHQGVSGGSFDLRSYVVGKGEGPETGVNITFVERLS